MTVFEKIKAMNINEFAEWYEQNCLHDNDPSINWWNDTYCLNCEPEIGRYIDSNKDMEFAWCELHGKCRFFQDMDKTPNTIQMIKLWLESDV